MTSSIAKTDNFIILWFCTLSVLEFTIQLLDKGIENDFLLALVIFNIQYVLVNHEYWKFKVKHSRWKVTLKVRLLVFINFSYIPVLILYLSFQTCYRLANLSNIQQS